MPTLHCSSSSPVWLKEYSQRLGQRFLECRRSIDANLPAPPPLAPLVQPDLILTVVGRVASCVSVEAKKHLHDDGVEYVFVFDASKLRILESCQSLYHMFQHLGASESRLIDTFVKGGECAILILAALPKASLFETTWEGITQVVASSYPRASAALAAHMPTLQARGGPELFREVEAATPAPYRYAPQGSNMPWGLWACLSEEGRQRGAYFGYSELCREVLDKGGAAAMQPSLWQLRLFLYCELRLNEHFEGAGGGERLLRNMKTSDFFDVGGVYIDLGYETMSFPKEVLSLPHVRALPFAMRFGSALAATTVGGAGAETTVGNAGAGTTVGNAGANSTTASASSVLDAGATHPPPSASTSHLPTSNAVGAPHADPTAIAASTSAASGPPPHPTTTNAAFLEIASLYEKHGTADYVGEAVSQQEHALQAAECARQDGADEETILAALLHDIGHVLGLEHPDKFSRMGAFGVSQHERVAQEWLAVHGFPPTVGLLVANHVNAKRYLVWKSPSYHDSLSDASKATLVFQGGPMSSEEAAAFEASPLKDTILKMRSWDEKAKVVGLNVPSLNSYLPLFEKHVSVKK